MSFTRREERRWRRDLSSRSSKPSANERYIVDSAAQIAYAYVLKNRYAEQVIQNKYIVEMKIPTGKGKKKSITTKYWTLTPDFLDRLQNGYEMQRRGSNTRYESDYEEVEVMMKMASVPVSLSIRDVHHPSNFNWSRPNGEFFKWYINMNVFGCHEFRQHILPILERIPQMGQ